MKTLSQALQESRKLLEMHRVSRPRQAAEEILATVLRLTRVELYLQFDRPVQGKEWRHCHSLLKRRIEGEPLEYISKFIDFFRCTIEVTPEALIPRQETEILLHKACSVIKTLEKRPLVAWDICTGTGCLGLGLKRFFPGIDITLSDISKECLSLAHRNAQRNNLNIHLAEGNLLAPFEGKKADIILCNPPYISNEEYETLEKSVRCFEPKLALVGGPTGLEYYAYFAKHLPNYLNDGAWVFFEIGTRQGEAILELFDTPNYDRRTLSKDWAGHDRFLFLRYTTKERPCSAQ